MSLHPADPVYTLEDDAAEPLSESKPGPPALQLAFLALGLLVFAVLCVLPIALVTWFLSVFFGGVGIAELLERTRGLAPTTYGGAFWLATVFTAVMVVLEVRAMVRPAGERKLLLTRFITHPSTAMVVLALPTYPLVRWDMSGTDVPDILTTTLLLCCLGYVFLVLPLGLLSVSWRLTRWLWNLGRHSGFAAGVLGAGGLLLGTCVPVTCGADDDDEGTRSKAAQRIEEIGEAYERGLRGARGKDVIDGSLALMGSLSTVIDEKSGSSPGSGPEHARGRGFPLISGSEPADHLPRWAKTIDSEWFDPCVRLLHDGGSQSLRDKKIIRFVYDFGMRRPDAEEVVDDALFETCARHSVKHYANVEAVFHQKAQSRRINRHRKSQRRGRSECQAAVSGAFYESTDLSLNELLDFENALCSVEESDRELLWLVVEGHDAKEIGRRLGIGSSTVRKRKERALARLRDRLH